MDYYEHRQTRSSNAIHLGDVMPDYQKKLIRALLILTIVFISLLFCYGCSRNAAYTQIKEETGTRVAPAMLLSAAPEIHVAECGEASIDHSNLAQGYFMVNYHGENPDIKLRVNKDGEECVYVLEQKHHNKYTAFPLTEGSGEYSVVIYEHKYGTTYLEIFSKRFYAEIEDEPLPYLYPSNLVNYSEDSIAVNQAAALAETANTDADVIRETLDYVLETIDYDHQFAENAPPNYIPDIDSVIEAGKGICLDMATVMAAMLRSQGIPAKVKIGDVQNGEETVYHAWVSVYATDGSLNENQFIDDEEMPGWVDIDPGNTAKEKFKQYDPTCKYYMNRQY